MAVRGSRLCTIIDEKASGIKYDDNLAARIIRQVFFAVKEQISVSLMR